MHEPSLWGFIVNADIVVKVVLILLIIASIASWTIIIQRNLLLKRIRRQSKQFEQQFWSGIELNTLYSKLSPQPSGLAHIFRAGYQEFRRLYNQDNIQRPGIIEGTERAMQAAQINECDRLQASLTLLATIGSTSPYVGLFGTVWGIISALHALGSMQQATISMVAPGISEALIATAIGLFTAIPAVIAYNRFTNQVDRLNNRFEAFQAKLTNILQRKL